MALLKIKDSDSVGVNVLKQNIASLLVLTGGFFEFGWVISSSEDYVLLSFDDSLEESIRVLLTDYTIVEEGFSF